MDKPLCAAARSANGRRSGGDLLSQHSTGRDAMAKDKEVSREERLERLAHQELRHDTIGNLNAGYAGFQLRRRVKKKLGAPVGNKFSLLVHKFPCRGERKSLLRCVGNSRIRSLFRKVFSD